MGVKPRGYAPSDDGVGSEYKLPWSSYQGCMVDALALGGDEGRGQLR